MPLRAFVQQFVQPRDDDALAQDAAAPQLRWRGYLAQHALLERLPALGVEAPPPRCLPAARADRRVWLGPAGTATPLHRDPYHNLFCQLHGRKRLRLYAASQAAALYPFEQPAALRLASRVDVDLAERLPDSGAAAAAAARSAAAFPAFAAAPFWQAELAPGEALAMRAGVWHAVLALDPSLSVSFWWT